MALTDLPTQNKVVIAIAGAISIVWAFDWLQDVGVMEYKLILVIGVALIIFMEYTND